MKDPVDESSEDGEDIALVEIVEVRPLVEESDVESCEEGEEVAVVAINSGLF